MTIGAILQAASYGVPQLLIGRIVAGIGLGVCIPIFQFNEQYPNLNMKLVVSNIIMWQTEISPGRMRGRLVASSLTFLILGDVRCLTGYSICS